MQRGGGELFGTSSLATRSFNDQADVVFARQSDEDKLLDAFILASWGSHDVKILAFVLCSKKNCSICKAAERFTRLLIVLNKVQAPVRLLILCRHPASACCWNSQRIKEGIGSQEACSVCCIACQLPVGLLRNHTHGNDLD